MDKYIEQVFNWTAISQGVIGSGLFALILFLASITIRFAIKHSLLFTKKKRRALLGSERLRYKGLSSGNLAFAGAATNVLIYGSLGSLYKAITALVLGYLLSFFSPAFKYISCIFALYYLLLAIDAVRDVHSSKKEDLKERLLEIEEKIKKIDEAA